MAETEHALLRHELMWRHFDEPKQENTNMVHSPNSPFPPMPMPMPGDGLTHTPYLSDDAANILHDTLRAMDDNINAHVRELDNHVAGIRECSEEIDKLYGERASLAAELSQKAAPDFTPRSERNGCAMAPMPVGYRPQRFQRPHPLSR